jgi:protein-tyrosine phosphatase
MKVYTVIEDQLFMRPEFHKLKNKIVDLQALKIDTVFCMLQRGDADLPGVVEYIHRPLPDGKTIDIPYVYSIVDEVENCLSQGKRVLVHCIAGKNRSGLICALTVRRALGLSGAAAVAHVRHCRPGALTNPYFVEYLEKLL